MRPANTICAALLIMPGCVATLPEPRDPELRIILEENQDVSQAQQQLAKCVLEWYEKSGTAPGMGDLAALAAGLGFGAETGPLTAPAAVIIYSAFLRPYARSKDRRRFLAYCLQNQPTPNSNSESDKEKAGVALPSRTVKDQVSISIDSESLHLGDKN